MLDFFLFIEVLFALSSFLFIGVSVIKNEVLGSFEFKIVLLDYPFHRMKYQKYFFVLKWAKINNPCKISFLQGLFMFLFYCGLIDFLIFCCVNTQKLKQLNYHNRG